MVEALTKLGEAARRAREYISPWSYLSPSDVASNLPGGGIPAAVEPYKQGLQKTAQATQAFREGRWGDAARWYGSGMLDTGTAAVSALPEGAALTKLAMVAAPAVRKVADTVSDGAGAIQKLAGIRAFHGSPHDFDRFDMSKIGTGEGAQAYGHGLYFAENEGVARSYRDALAKEFVQLNGERVPHDAEGADVIYRLANHMQQMGKSADEVIADAAERAKLLSGNLSSSDFYKQRAAQSASDWAKAVEPYRGKSLAWEQDPGKMYEVRINADPEHFLDWDKRIDQQSQKVRDAIQGVAKRIERPAWQGHVPDYPEDTTVGYWLKDLGDRKGPNVASAALKEQGVPGIKYLDAGSRGAGDGTRNYVVFDDKLVEIIRKYGWMPGMAIPAAMALEMQQAQEQSAPQM